MLDHRREEIEIVKIRPNINLVRSVKAKKLRFAKNLTIGCNEIVE